MTDEQKGLLKEHAKRETASPSQRHVSTTERGGSPQSESVRSRGPSRSHQGLGKKGKKFGKTIGASEERGNLTRLLCQAFTLGH